MIRPIYAYGEPVLKKKAEEISKDYPNLTELIDDMFETMYHSNGVGLAAPQIGLPIRLFIVDCEPFEEDEAVDLKEVFINARIILEEGEPWKFNEGCLSIPGVREDVSRQEMVHIEYYDAEWNFRKTTFTGIAARVIQHEYDHIEGVLFTDRISPLRRRLLKNRLNDISKGHVKVDYRMKFPNKTR